MRFWLSTPIFRRTRIGVSVSDREIARVFRARPVTVVSGIHLDEIGNRLDVGRYYGEPDADYCERIQEAEREARAQAFAKRWTPFVNWFIVISFVAFVISMLVWGQYLSSKL